VKDLYYHPASPGVEKRIPKRKDRKEYTIDLELKRANSLFYPALDLIELKLPSEILELTSPVFGVLETAPDE